MYAEVVLDRISRDLDRLYHYAIPSSLAEKVQIGQQVLVPFGRSQERGYLVGFVEQAEVKEVKEILEISSAEPFFSPQSLALARWIADYYGSFLISALRLFMPLRRGKGRERRAENVERRTEEGDSNVPGARFYPQPTSPNFQLTKEQALAVTEITAAIDGGQAKSFLLYGVTGSGKTEVYLRAIAHLLQKGKGAIVLVPEIGLTPQMIKRFQERFGNNIAVIHSHLTDKERRSEWEKVDSGEARIVIGARSAIFAPVKNLGIIILDEEYETSYKSEKSPRYHAREVAVKLGEIHQAVVVLGSATPALETYYQAQQGKYSLLKLTRRIANRPLPPVEIIDLRAEMKAKNYSLLSARLRAEIGRVLAAGEQIILFLNRLGYFTFVICRECGTTLECPNCSVSLVYHSSNQKIHCTRCGYQTAVATICPQCNSSAIRYFGTGTQRIEDEVAKSFPTARILRWDHDAVSQRGSHEKFFANFAAGHADILIGTQMVAKGLDVAKVTLVGVVSADTALNLPDFRSAERTFQLLTQVAGRAGRHHLPGKVIIQTYAPENYAIQAAAKHDFDQFFEQEVKHRKELGYPPFARLIHLMLTSIEAETTLKFAEELASQIRENFSGQVLGPAAAAIAKQRGEFRFQILLKSLGTDELADNWRSILKKAQIPRGVKISVDVDPLGMV